MKFFENIKTIVGEVIGLFGGFLWASKSGWDDFEPLILLSISGIGLIISFLSKLLTKNKDKTIVNKNYTIRTFTENGEEISEVEGEVEVNTITWKAKTNLPLFKTIPEISLNRLDGQTRNSPNITEITENSFTISINSSSEAGQWNWRAVGKLRK